ncbi:M48 metallopeptidase family protein, partial [Francisella tularensis]|uniref:M48 metallopeptidase family protein n=1 Tax=Francisella tularensis TaxID=263 RepID=UPI002381A0A0
DIILNNLVAKYLKITNQEITGVTIKKTKTRWGSCNYVKKTINLNFNLFLRDIQAIEYVVLHEIAHLTHTNHSKEFYAYVASYIP